MAQSHIVDFISRVRRRLNVMSALWLLPYAWLELNVIAMSAALYWILYGLKAPLLIIPFTAVTVTLISGLIWFLKLSSLRDAAIFGDRFFDLRDALVSELELSGNDAFNELRREQTTARCRQLDVSTIKFKSSSALWLAGLPIFLLNIWIFQIDESPYVTAGRAREKAIEVRSGQVNKRLRDKLKNLTVELDEKQKDELNKAGVYKSIDKLKPSKELKKSLMQLADLEQRLQRLHDGIQPDPDLQEALKKFAAELKRSSAMQELGKMLATGKNAQSAAEFKKMKVGKATGQKLRDKLKKLLELKAASKRMPDDNSELIKNLSELSKSVSELEKESANSKDSELSKCESCGKVDDDLDKLAKLLKEQAARDGFKKKLAAMLQAAVDAQGNMLSNKMGPGGGKSGQGAGSAAQGNMDNKDKTGKSGYMSKLTGRKNSTGPGAKNTMDASLGQGVSRRETSDADRNFKYQLEEFFVRDDVPADMKNGVKKYFSELHAEKP